MASKKPKSLTALAQSLDTRKREPPVVPLPKGDNRGPLLTRALMRRNEEKKKPPQNPAQKIEQKLASLPPVSNGKVTLPPKVAPPPAPPPPKAVESLPR